MAFARSLAIFLTLLAASRCCAATLDAELSPDDVAALRRSVELTEGRFIEFVAQVETYRWTSHFSGKPTVAETLHIVCSRDRLHEVVLVRDSEKIQPTCRLRAFDGQILTDYTPPNDVAHHSGPSSIPRRFRPNAVLLDALGCGVTLAELLAAEKGSIDRMFVENVMMETRRGSVAVRVRATQRLPGSSNGKTLELCLSVADDYFPFWGRFTDINGEVTEASAESDLGSMIRRIPRYSVEQEIRVTKTSASPATLPRFMVVRFSAEQLSRPPADEFFRIGGLVGNPTVRDFRDGKLMDEHSYWPHNEPEIAWPAYVKWLLVNDIVLAGFILFYCGRLMLRRILHVRRRSRNVRVGDIPPQAV